MSNVRVQGGPGSVSGQDKVPAPSRIEPLELAQPGRPRAVVNSVLDKLKKLPEKDRAKALEDFKNRLLNRFDPDTPLDPDTPPWPDDKEPPFEDWELDEMLKYIDEQLEQNPRSSDADLLREIRKGIVKARSERGQTGEVLPGDKTRVQRPKGHQTDPTAVRFPAPTRKP